MIKRSIDASPKPCKFCCNNAQYSPIDEMIRHGVGVFFCYPCNAEYIYFFDGLCASTSLYTEINNNTYRYTITSSGIGALSQIIDPGIPGKRKNGSVKQIKRFESSYTPSDITAQNINDKIRTWLLFV